jgi:mycothiol synthase
VEHEFSVAELTPDRLPDVVALCREALDLPEDAAEAAEIVARLRGTSAAGERRTTGFVALAGGAVTGVVLGSTAFRDPSIGHVDLIAVHPEHRRLGIGRALLNRVEGALAASGAGEVRLAGNAPVYAWPGIDVRYTPAVCAAMALGYEHDHTAWNMTADLTALPSVDDAEQRLAGRGVTVRRAGAADADRLVAFVREHFGPGWGGEVADSLDKAGAGCHLAERAGELLGFAAYGSSRPSWFGPIGTAPAARGLGAGGALLLRCLGDQAATGLTRAQISWVGPVPFYAAQAGAWIERVFFLYRKSL